VNHLVGLHVNLMLQFDEQKDQVAVEQILRVVFLDAERSSPVSLSQASSFFQLLSWRSANLGEIAILAYTFRNYSWKQMDKLKRQLAEAEAALEARKKPPEDSGQRIVGEGLVIDEWVRSLFSGFQ
jgi:hypothetical protein